MIRSACTRRFRPLTLAVAAASLLTLTAIPVFALAIIQPVIIDCTLPSDTYTAGSSVPLEVTFDGSGDTNITVYSSPAGAVSYTGSVSGPTANIIATSNSTTTGPVTVYVAAEGTDEIASTTVYAVEPPGGGDTHGLRHATRIAH